MLPARSFLLLAALGWAATAAAAPPGWSLRDGDRVVLLGDAFVERDGELGIIESALVAGHPRHRLSFRNLGWTGDTVWAESRGVFDPPSAGYARMLTLVKELHPTVLVVAYGRNESFAGQAGQESFRAQLVRLCADLRTAAAVDRRPDEVRLVLVTPHPFENGPGIRAADRDNLAAYADIVREVAADERAGLVDLHARLRDGVAADTRLTTDGSHLSAAGYEAAARVFVATSGGTRPATSTAADDELRRAIAHKNMLFFHRWRPANETYLFLFRRHEQGNNAVEVSQFDPLVDAAEARIHDLVRPPADSRP